MFRILILLLPCFVSLYSAITLFIRRKRNYRSQNIWMVCAFLMSVSHYVWAMYYIGVEDFSLYYKLDIIDATVGLSFLPVVYLYFKSLTDEAPLKWKESLWFIPGLLVGVGSLVTCLWMGDEQATVYMQKLIEDFKGIGDFASPIQKAHYAINVQFYYTTFIIQLILLLRYTIVRLVVYRKRLEDFYSNPEGKSMENIKAMLVGVLALVGIALLAALELGTLYHKHSWVVCVLFTTYACILYYLNNLALSVEYTAESLAEKLQQTDKEAEELGYTTSEDVERGAKNISVIRPNRRDEIVLRMNELLDEEKIFLQKDLRLDDIVRLTQANRTYVSLLISEEYRCSFWELINSRRINYAKDLAQSNPNLSHAQIAEESGFAYPSSFSRTFKQYTGTTFKEWYVQVIAR